MKISNLLNKLLEEKNRAKLHIDFAYYFIWNFFKTLFVFNMLKNFIIPVYSTWVSFHDFCFSKVEQVDMTLFVIVIPRHLDVQSIFTLLPSFNWPTLFLWHHLIWRSTPMGASLIPKLICCKTFICLFKTQLLQNFVSRCANFTVTSKGTPP